MGITNLLSLVKDATHPVNVSQFRGKVVAVDASCWLHKALFGCADSIAQGTPTDRYVNYCVRLVTLLLSYNLKVVLVFDGASLPAKKETNRSRKERREAMKEKGKLLFEQGLVDRARCCFQQSLEIEFYMIVDIIQACKKLENVQCIVAPYEADAQLAYLSLKGHVELVISEDSDLIPFGCPLVLYKMDLNGNGVLYDQRCLAEALKIAPPKFDFTAFRRMCIMAGCDYLHSLPGIGVRKAAKFFAKTTEQDLKKALPKIPKYLEMKKLQVPEEYVDRFIEAENTFLYQIVFDPVERKMVPLTPYPDGLTGDAFPYAGKMLTVEVACDLADGNIHPHSHEWTSVALSQRNKTSPENRWASGRQVAVAAKVETSSESAFETSNHRMVRKTETRIQEEHGKEAEFYSELSEVQVERNEVGQSSESRLASCVSSYFVGREASCLNFLQYLSAEAGNESQVSPNGVSGSLSEQVAWFASGEGLFVTEVQRTDSSNATSCFSALQKEESAVSFDGSSSVPCRNPFKVTSIVTPAALKQESGQDEEEDATTCSPLSTTSASSRIDPEESAVCGSSSSSQSTAAKRGRGRFYASNQSLSQSASSTATLERFFSQAVVSDSGKKLRDSADVDCVLVEESRPSTNRMKTAKHHWPSNATSQVNSKSAKTKQLGLSKRKRVPSLHAVRKVKTEATMTIQEHFQKFVCNSQP